MTKFHHIDGLKIEIVEVRPTTDIRFLSQRQLKKMRTQESYDELARRAGLIAAQRYIDRTMD